MSTINFYPHQQKELDETANLNKVAYYHDMGLGKTFVGAEKLVNLNEKINLVICQKSKINDWLEHFKKYYDYKGFIFCDLTLDKSMTNQFIDLSKTERIIGFINYELAFRRKELLKLKDFTLMLDESSLIQNEKAKRTKFIMKLKFKNLILLSGTPVSGKYEKLYSQIKMLGWDISKDLFYNQYVNYHYEDKEGFPIMIVDGYKNVERLKLRLRGCGCRFLKTEEVFDLPEQKFIEIKVNSTKAYQKFRKDKIIKMEDEIFVGDTILNKMLYERLICGRYNLNKLKALEDLILSTEDRLIIFYNFNVELDYIKFICRVFNRNVSVVNGEIKDLTAYENDSSSVCLIQYQAGAMGLNLQKANKIIYFTPPLSSELFEQSKKRTHRIGQDKSCFYYELICKNSIEEKIYKTLAMRKDYTDELFKEGENDG